MRPILDGKRIRLIALERHHLPFRVRFINDPKVQATLNFDFPTSLAKTEAWFQKNVLASDRMDFAIETQRQETIGFGGLLNINRVIKKCELYIFIGDRSFWGKGYGNDAYKLITNYAFAELGMNKVYGYQLTLNNNARKSVESIGWSVDGVLREDIHSHGELKDQYIVSILRSEWGKNTIYDDV